jgi:hypothetical protein
LETEPVPPFSERGSDSDSKVALVAVPAGRNTGFEKR